MAITHHSSDNIRSANTLTSISDTISLPTASNCIVIMCMGTKTNSQPHAHFWDGVAFDQDNWFRIGVWTLSFSHKVLGSLSGGTATARGDADFVENWNMSTMIFSGVDQSTPFTGDIIQYSSTLSTSVSLGGMQGEEGSLSIACAMNDNATTYAPVGGVTEIREDNQNGIMLSLYKKADSSSSFTFKVITAAAIAQKGYGRTLNEASAGPLFTARPTMFFTLAGLVIPAATLAGLYQAGAVPL